MKRENELNAKGEAADVARNAVSTSNAKVEEMELQLQKCIIERNEIEVKLEEAIQDSGKTE